MCVHFISEFNFYAILNIQLCNRNKVTLKNIHYVSVSSIQFNEQDSLQLNLTFSQTAQLTEVKLTLTRIFNEHWFTYCKQDKWKAECWKEFTWHQHWHPKSKACGVSSYDITMYKTDWFISKRCLYTFNFNYSIQSNGYHGYDYKNIYHKNDVFSSV